MDSEKIKAECRKLVEIDPTLYALLILARKTSHKNSKLDTVYEGFRGDEEEICNRLLAIRMSFSREEYDKAWRFVDEF